MKRFSIFAIAGPLMAAVRAAKNGLMSACRAGVYEGEVVSAASSAGF
jgi:hypothetical protein